jgi:flavin-dependent dehydrogenase
VGREYDLLIVGGGPAGSAAAIAARRAGLSVLLIEREPEGRERSGLGWIGPAGVELCRDCGLSTGRTGAEPFRELRLFSWDLKRSTTVAERGLGGWIVARESFDRALRDLAGSAGAEMLLGISCEAVASREERVVLSLSDGRRVAGGVLILADGLDSALARSVNLVAAGDLPRVSHCVRVELETPAGEVGLDVVLGGHRLGVQATIMRTGRRVCFALLTREAPREAENRASAFLQAAQAAGLLPRAVVGAPVIERSPAGLALEMESHVGKRCLLVGAGGGFVGAFSNEGIYPAMKSGWIAAETAARALKQPVVQDELASFGTAWRTQLAEYLRMPQTDFSLLMPLVFGAKPMSRRVARAFLLGEPI